MESHTYGRIFKSLGTHVKTFRLLIQVFALADTRRRERHCARG
nr:DUF5958 family protein [Kitasatospora aureofaciens]